MIYAATSPDNSSTTPLHLAPGVEAGSRGACKFRPFYTPHLRRWAPDPLLVMVGCAFSVARLKDNGSFHRNEDDESQRCENSSAVAEILVEKLVSRSKIARDVQVLIRGKRIPAVCHGILNHIRDVLGQGDLLSIA